MPFRQHFVQPIFKASEHACTLRGSNPNQGMNNDSKSIGGWTGSCRTSKNTYSPSSQPKVVHVQVSIPNKVTKLARKIEDPLQIDDEPEETINIRGYIAKKDDHNFPGIRKSFKDEVNSFLSETILKRLLLLIALDLSILALLKSLLK